jgi:hypothetical protein
MIASRDVAHLWKITVPEVTLPEDLRQVAPIPKGAAPVAAAPEPEEGRGATIRAGRTGRSGKARAACRRGRGGRDGAANGDGIPVHEYDGGGAIGA